MSRRGSSTRRRTAACSSARRLADSCTTAFVGRESELQRLTAIYEEAAGERRARLGMVIGSPGLGKSRLLAEITRDLDARATVVFGRCDHAGGTTFAPVADA